ncbi:MAG: nitroreductase family protein [Candidatus Methanodesulfokora sp.]|jgi:nitroreductase
MEECLKLLLGRRSIRVFEDKEVSDGLIKRILDVARYAPSAKNSQPWEFVVVRDEEVRRKLASIHRYAYPPQRAPVAIAVLCNPELSPDSYLVDCANATIYLMLAAHALGLGTVWIQSLRNVKEINEILGSEGRIPVALIALGWPAEKPEARPRRELKEIVYINRYGERLIK